MKGSENHIGLEKKEIRDYISKSLANSYTREYSYQKEPIVGDNPQEREINRLEQDIEHSKKLIEVHKDRLAILQIMRSEGWEEHDISDYIVQEKGVWLHFIGTEEEYQVISKKIEENQH